MQTSRIEFNGDREIVITREFDAPRELVWKAWTDPKLVAEWWGPRGFTGSRCDMELQPGGSFYLELNGPDAGVYPCVGVYREIVEPELLVFDGPKDESPGCGAGLPPNATVTVRFAEVGSKTRLTINTVLASASDRVAAINAGFSVGWSDSLDRLAESLSAGFNS